jgi:hypothetical protein
MERVEAFERYEVLIDLGMSNYIYQLVLTHLLEVFQHL